MSHGPDAVPELRTSRLLLRGWRESDREPFAVMRADPVVMEHYPRLADRAAADAMVDAMRASWRDRGYGLWAVEQVGGAPFVGYVGLAAVTFEASFAPAVEVGWSLTPSAWGHGYATEAAVAALGFGFDRDRGLDSIVSLTAVRNVRSARVMERLGMRPDPDAGFEHPRVPLGHPVRPHVLYRMSRRRWSAAAATRAAR